MKRGRELLEGLGAGMEENSLFILGIFVLFNFFFITDGNYFLYFILQQLYDDLTYIPQNTCSTHVYRSVALRIFTELGHRRHYHHPEEEPHPQPATLIPVTPYPQPWTTGNLRSVPLYFPILGISHPWKLSVWPSASGFFCLVQGSSTSLHVSTLLSFLGLNNLPLDGQVLQL